MGQSLRGCPRRKLSKWLTAKFYSTLVPLVASHPIAVGNGGYKMAAVYNGVLLPPLLDTRAT